MKQAQAGPVRLPQVDTKAPQGLELRHLRYLVAVADAGTFTRAAEQMFIAQSTLSQQIRQPEQLLGTPLPHRRGDGVQLTAAGAVLLDGARNVLSRVAITWMDTPLDAEFTPVREHRADAGLGWLTASPDTLPAPLDAMSLGQFEPEVWIPRSHPAARRGVIGLDELVGMDVIHGLRRASTATYDRWLTILRTADPRFEFTDPPLRHSLPVTLAFAATAGRPAAVLTGPVCHRRRPARRDPAAPARRHR
jgi:DNA-binding transcriptional LysR family regulator